MVGHNNYYHCWYIVVEIYLLIFYVEFLVLLQSGFTYPSLQMVCLFVCDVLYLISVSMAILPIQELVKVSGIVS